MVIRAVYFRHPSQRDDISRDGFVRESLSNALSQPLVGALDRLVDAVLAAFFVAHCCSSLLRSSSMNSRHFSI